MDDITLMAESEEELKSLLVSMKERSEKAGLRLNIKKSQITAPSSIISWQVEGENVEAGTGQISSSWALKLMHMVAAAMKLDECFLAGKL